MTNNHNSIQPYSQNEMNRFKKAVSSGNKEQIQNYIYSGKLTQNQLHQALFLSIQNYKVDDQSDECFFTLLRTKINPNIEINHQTPLIAACKLSQTTFIRYLLEHGAKPDLTNSIGQLPLQFLLDTPRENYDAAQQLISCMNNVNVQILNSTPILICIQKQFPRIFKFLVEKGAYLSTQQQTILHTIMKKKFKNKEKKKKFIKELVGRGLNNKKDSEGKYPEQYQNQEDIKQYYLQLFKPKIKQTDKSQSNNKTKNKKNKDQEQSFQDIQQLDNNLESSQAILLDKKIMEAGEDQQEDKKPQYNFKSKKNKTLSSSQTLNSFYQKTPKPLTKIVVQINQKQYKKQTGTKKLSNVNINKKKSNIKSKIQQSEVDQQPIKKIQKKSQKKQIEKCKNQKYQKNQQKVLDKKTQEKQIKQKIPQILQIYDKLLVIQSNKQAQQHQVHMRSIKQEFLKISKQLSSEQSDQQSDDDQQDPKSLIQQLNQQIASLVQLIDNNIETNSLIIQQVISFTKKNIQNLLIHQPIQSKIVQVILFGSHSYRLAVSHSDINLIICSSINSTELFHRIQQSQIFINKNITDIKFINFATYPIIKMIYKIYKVQLSFQRRGHSGIRCSQLIREFMNDQPLLRPLVLTLKTLIHSYGLDNIESGGLGSYSLTLMAIAVIQSTDLPKHQSYIGRLLMEFLLFYGYQMDYICQAIIIHPPGFAQKPVYSIYQLPYTIDLTPKLIIYDPLNPVNNVGAVTYQIIPLKRLYTVWYNRLHLNQCRLKDLTDGSFSELLSQYI